MYFHFNIYYNSNNGFQVTIVTVVITMFFALYQFNRHNHHRHIDRSFSRLQHMLCTIEHLNINRILLDCTECQNKRTN